MRCVLTPGRISSLDRVVFDGDIELLPRACQICQAVIHVIAVAGPDEVCGARELVIAAEHGLRIIRAYLCDAQLENQVFLKCPGRLGHSSFGMILATSSCPITIRNQLSRSVITRYCRSSAVPAR